MLRFFLALLVVSVTLAHAEVIERFGKGFLEERDGQKVLHLVGTPYERGEQHGKLLKEQVQKNLSLFLEGAKPKEQNERAALFKPAIPKLLQYIPQNLIEEMKGVAKGAEVPYEKILTLNLFPEMFHCSAITVKGNATKDGALYHVRVLDYAIGKGLQSCAILMVAEPDTGHAFLNVTYAGFVGSVTGMNAEKVAVGEIGGQGYGSWEGVPMAFLIRKILEEAGSLDEAKAILQNTPRTCEYFYIISDGKNSSSTGVYATKEQIQFIEPGTNYSLLAIGQKIGTECLSPATLQENAWQTVVLRANQTVGALILKQPNECLVMTGLTHPERYPVIAERLAQNFGSIDAQVLQQVIQGPAGKDSNLHNAIFLPEKLKVWVSHASTNGEPAYAQPYSAFSLPELLAK
jgi:hypothetical protein